MGKVGQSEQGRVEASACFAVRKDAWWLAVILWIENDVQESIVAAMLTV